jgi:hypothetical protein
LLTALSSGFSQEFDVTKDLKPPPALLAIRIFSSYRLSKGEFAAPHYRRIERLYP